MFARPWALVCLMIFGLCVGRSDPVVQADRTLVVYLNANANQSTKPIQFFKLELGALMRTAGYQLEWRETGKSSNDAGVATLVVLEMRGVCEPPNRDFASETVATVTLASTAVSDGQVLPFSWVNCRTLTELLASALSVQRSDQRDYLYGRAIARVVAHELYHVLANEREHSVDGVAKACFTLQDLMSSHFDFEESTLSRLRPQPSYSVKAVTEVLDDTASGR
ncbi:MAG: hypothetical protein JWO19_4020 [Bryobacterales bacterium]|jgi:hypothetical protein|nr:hypothetical protein [Bryobacterales bacterium]